MRWLIKRDRGGKEYYAISGYDPILKKNRTWKKSEIPSWVNSAEKADEFIKILQAQLQSATYRIQQKLKYKNQFFEFQTLASLYSSEMQKRSKVDWKNSVRDLEHFVFDFFLNIKHANNINDWPLHYSEFKDWLETTARPVKSNKSNISYSQMNSVISALNTFIEILKHKQKINFAVPKCPCFPQSLIKRRNEEDVLGEEEKKDLLRALNSINQEVADFVTVGLQVGGRVAELLGLSLADYHEGLPPQKILTDLLSQYNFVCYGYFAFNSQLVDPSKPRDLNNQVHRKPLKHRKQISASDYRFAPIVSDEVHNLIVDKYNDALADFDKKTYGTNAKDYLLFNLTEGQINKALKAAYQTLKRYKPKTSHCFRHTFTSDLAGKVATDHRVFELILGHRDQKTTQSYNHINQIFSRGLSTQKTISLGGMKKVTKKSP